MSGGMGTSHGVCVCLCVCSVGECVCVNWWVGGCVSVGGAWVQVHIKLCLQSQKQHM